MNRDDILIELNTMLLRERGETSSGTLTGEEGDRLFRALRNVRPPEPVSDHFLELQDRYLQSKTDEKGIVDVEGFSYRDNIALWQGDIARLKADAIVNACNSALLGCFQPLHNCIDNVIHSAAGVQVRRDCQEIMKGAGLPNGEVKVTGAYNLPSRYIFHTVGPIVQSGRPTEEDRRDLASCYLNSLDMAEEMGLESLVFCCLSTGVYGYPQDEAAQTAMAAVKSRLKVDGSLRVIFNVFLDKDREIYEGIL